MCHMSTLCIYRKSESDFFAEVSSAVTAYKGRIKKELKSD